MTLLILMRHAKAKAAAPTDHARELTARGHEQAQQAADWLKKTDCAPDFAVVSDSVRTRQTFEELNLNCEAIFDENAYNASSSELMDLIKAVQPDRECVLVIGHNPGISDLAFTLGHRRSVTPGSVVLAQWKGDASQLGRSAVQIIGNFSPNDDD